MPLIEHLWSVASGSSAIICTWHNPRAWVFVSSREVATGGRYWATTSGRSCLVCRRWRIAFVPLDICSIASGRENIAGGCFWSIASSRHGFGCTLPAFILSLLHLCWPNTSGRQIKSRDRLSVVGRVCSIASGYWPLVDRLRS